MEVQKRSAAVAATDPEDPAMVLTFKDLDTIGRLIRRNLSSDKDALIHAISTLVSIDVEGVSVPLEPRLLSRLKSRCLKRDDWPKWLSEVTVKQLHDYAGY